VEEVLLVNACRYYELMRYSLSRYAHESEDGPECSLRRYETKPADRAIIKDIMRASSTTSKGFLIYLNENAKEYLDRNQPSLVITLDEIEALLKTESNQDNDSASDNGIIHTNRNKNRKQIASKQLLSRAKEIMRTSQFILKNIEAGIYKTHRGASFNYNIKEFNSLESDFFYQNKTVEGVLNSYIEKVKRLPALFEWIPKDVLTKDHMERIELKRLETER